MVEEALGWLLIAMAGSLLIFALLLVLSPVVAWLRSRRKRHGLSHCKECWEAGLERGLNAAMDDMWDSQHPTLKPSSPPTPGRPGKQSGS